MAAEYQMKDFYSILEVESDATDKEINRAYRKLAKKWHPDVCKEEDAVDRYKEIVDAYTILSEPDERENYDYLVRTQGIGFEDVVRQFYYHKPGAHSPIQGEHIEMNFRFRVEDILTEAEKVVEFDRFINCEKCEGHGIIRELKHMCSTCGGVGTRLVTVKNSFGEIQAETECGRCGGKGYEKSEECDSCKGRGKKNVMVTLNFNVPKEATEGYRLRFRGKGDGGLNGGRNGDLILTFIQAPDDPYEIINKYDLKTKVSIPYDIALLGGEFPVHLPHTDLLVTIPQGIQNGHLLLFPDEGLRGKRGNGSLTLVVNIDLPTNLSNEKKAEIVHILRR